MVHFITLKNEYGRTVSIPKSNITSLSTLHVNEVKSRILGHSESQHYSADKIGDSLPAFTKVRFKEAITVSGFFSAYSEDRLRTAYVKGNENEVNTLISKERDISERCFTCDDLTKTVRHNLSDEFKQYSNNKEMMGNIVFYFMSALATASLAFSALALTTQKSDFCQNAEQYVTKTAEEKRVCGFN